MTEDILVRATALDWNEHDEYDYGKYGTEDLFTWPTTWEATDERIDGLLAIIGMLNTEVYDTAGPVFEEKNRLVRMLRAMLEEVGQK